MSKDKIDPRLQEWLDGDLSPEEEQRLRESLEEDEALRDEHGRMQSLIRSFTAMEHPAPSATFADRVAQAALAQKAGRQREPRFATDIAIAVSMMVFIFGGFMMSDVVQALNAGLDAAASPDLWIEFAGNLQGCVMSLARGEWLFSWNLSTNSPSTFWLIVSMSVLGAAWVALQWSFQRTLKEAAPLAQQK